MVSLLASFFLTMKAAAAPASQPTTDPARHWELLSYGSGERLWYAVTTPSPSQDAPRTFVREREMQGDWHDLNNFPSRLISLGELRGQLAASLENSEWKRISADQFASGPPLPGHGDMLAIAGFEGTLWAIGFAEGARPEAAVPASSPSATKPATTSATGPTTRPEQLQLYQLIGDRWTRIAALPEEVRAARGKELSLVISKGAPWIAYKHSANVARISRFSVEAKAWSPAGQMEAGYALRKLKLMTAHDKPVGWAIGEAGVGSFFFPADATPAGDSFWKEQALTVSADLKVMDATAAAAGDELHLIALQNNEEFIEKKYDLTGHEKMKAFEPMPEPKNPGETTLKEVIQWGLLGLLMVITLAAANKGGPVQVVSVNNVELAVAPFSLRLAAGLIDLWPMYIGFGLIVFHAHSGVKLSQIYKDRFANLAEIASMGVYVLHTLVCEIIWARSIGKMCVGLRVAGIDGKRATVGSIVLRNLMRLIEVILTLPLLVIFFNPLRQRVGDFAAGTLVVAKVPKNAEKELVSTEQE